MANIDVKELLEAGAHFGHKTSHWHPGMAPYIHSERGGIYIIDLIKTQAQLEKALEFIKKEVALGKDILFVGTKKQLKQTTSSKAQEVSMPYVAERWLGGMLTNFATISTRIKHLKNLEEKLESGEFEESYNKREVAEFREEAEKINEFFGGIKEMTKLPGLMFVADVVTEKTAIKEAKILGIPVIGICDSNANPTDIDYVIPANDDALKTVEIITGYIVEAVKEGKAQRKAKTSAEPAKSPAKSGSAVPEETEPNKTKNSTKSKKAK
ncbi:MAG: 30S ribosomal protein S2 [Candidatus Saccharimonadales bacterium]